MARLPNLAPLEDLAWAPARTSLPSVPTPPHSVYCTEGGKLGNSPAACRQLSIIRAVAPTEATLCACQAPAFYSLLAAPQGSQAAQPASTQGKTRAENRRRRMEQSQDGEARARGWILEPSGGLGVGIFPESPPHPLPSVISDPLGGVGVRMGVVGRCISEHRQSAVAMAGWGFPQQKLLACWGLATGASAVPSDVSSGFAFQEPAAQDFKGVP